MTTKPTTLADLMDDYDAERIAELDREEARRNTPEAIARREAKRKEEFERGVRLGWHDEEGNPIASDDEDADEDEEESEE